ncbi:MAG: alkaline phosphatase family protein [Halioglobus sp.]
MRSLATLTLAFLCQAGLAAESPRLVLQVTVDGLRGDLLSRYESNFAKGGFAYLLEKGAVFTSAHYQHGNTETIVGHTTLATGATPAVHGMVGNVWYHADTGELGYNIEDPEAPILPTRSEVAKGAQVDPAQQRSTSAGRSPRGILAPTLADTLAISGAGKSKVFGISGKDRSAVAMAGQVGTAYWYSTDTGDFQTSAYYMDAYPDWVSDWNAQGRAAALSGTAWELMLDTRKYRLAAQDDRPYEVDLKGYGKVFPHPFGNVDHPLFFTRVLVSPEGDVLLAEFAKSLIEAEQLGQDGVTDYLSVSFSAVDAVNHFFGPSSLENEDVVLRLDRTLAGLLQFVDAKVGLEHTLIVLSADHGMAEMPEYASEQGFHAERLYDHEVLELARNRAEELFGTPRVVKDFYRPYIYLDREVLSERDLEVSTAIDLLAAAVQRKQGIRAAVPSARAAELGHAAVAHNHHPLRSGDIYVYQDPHWFLTVKGPIGVMHGSPWAYDTHVPIVFAGPGVQRGRYDRQVHPVDVAPTLAALLRLPPPAAATGQVLPEALED